MGHRLLDFSEHAHAGKLPEVVRSGNSRVTVSFLALNLSGLRSHRESHSNRLSRIRWRKRRFAQSAHLLGASTRLQNHAAVARTPARARGARLRLEAAYEAIGNGREEIAV